MTEPDRSRFTALPEGPRPEEWVETTDTSMVSPPEQEVQAAWRTTLLGTGG